MARITTPVEGFNGTVVGVTFTDGHAETDSHGAIAYFTRKGYTVENSPGSEPAHAEGEPNDKWKVDALKAYADAHDIDLGDASKKADILEALGAATDTKTQESDTDGNGS